MIRDVQRCPSVRCLMDLKDCLDFCSTSWVSLFCQLGGATLLLQVIPNTSAVHALQSKGKFGFASVQTAPRNSRPAIGFY